MKKIKLSAIGILMASLLVGCGASNKSPIIATIESQPIETQEESQAESQEVEEGRVSDTATIVNRVVIDGQKQSYLTGEWKDEAVVNRRSMAVMLSNNKASLPQYGISQASIIYEAPVEGRITRLMAFFEDYDDLKYIGPVRSSRDYFVYEAMPYDAIYVNWGLAIPFVEDLLKSDRVDNISQALTGIHNPAPEAFDRISRPGYSSEYTGYLMIDGYKKGVERLGYETDYRSTFDQAFTFADDGHKVTYDNQETATKIYPGGKNSNSGGYGNHQPSFEYNEEDELYYRYQFSAKHIDEMNGEQLAVTNVVFKYCHGEVREPSSYDYLAFGVHGSGDALIFTNGKVIKGTWKRANDNSANLFYDKNGNEIVLNQGKTWICNIWDEYSEYVSYE